MPKDQMLVVNNYLKASQETHKAEFQQMYLFCPLIIIRYYQKMIHRLTLELFATLYYVCCNFVCIRLAKSVWNPLGLSTMLSIRNILTIFRCRSSSIKIFSGFRSLCIILASCKCFSPDTISAAYTRASYSLSLPKSLLYLIELTLNCDKIT